MFRMKKGLKPATATNDNPRDHRRERQDVFADGLNRFLRISKHADARGDSAKQKQYLYAAQGIHSPDFQRFKNIGIDKNADNVCHIVRPQRKTAQSRRQNHTGAHGHILP